jgi:GT2 family glycosyltransferase
MDLSIVIVTFNSRRFIDACLGSVRIALDEARDLSVEVRVVDNCSSDGTAKAVRSAYPWVGVTEQTANRGFAHGVNTGLRETSGEFVLWLNPDSVLLEGAGRGLSDTLAWMRQHPRAGIAGGRILDPSGSVQRSVRAFPSYGSVLGARYSFLTRVWPNNPFSRKFLRADLSYDSVAAVDWVSGACLLHRRAVSDQLHGLDDGYFMYFEDVDFCYRATQAGWTVHFHPGFSVTHHIGGSSDLAPVGMLRARHRSMRSWYTKTFPRFWPKDAVVFMGIWARCGWLSMARVWRR